MITYPTYRYAVEDANRQLARFVRLDNPDGYVFDNFHSHEYNELLVFIKGGGTHNINFQNHPITDCSIHLLAAQDLHWVERSKDSYGFAIVYKDQFLEKLQFMNPDINYREQFDYSRILTLEGSLRENFSHIFQELLGNQQDAVYMLNLIGAFLTKIATAFTGNNRQRKTNDPVIFRLIHLVDLHYKEHLPVSEYAAKLHIAPSTLQKRIRKASGKSLLHLQQERLMKEAKRLLITSGQSIAEITYELGFKEPAHFSNWFRKQTGIAPSEYKG